MLSDAVKGLVFFKKNCVPLRELFFSPTQSASPLIFTLCDGHHCANAQGKTNQHYILESNCLRKSASQLFSHVHTTLQSPMSVCPSIGLSVGQSVTLCFFSDFSFALPLLSRCLVSLFYHPLPTHMRLW